MPEVMQASDKVPTAEEESAVDPKKDYEDMADEISDLRQSLESFEKEKERVRAIIGNIGGVPTFHTKLLNAGFVVIIVAAGVVSIFSDEAMRLLMIELTTVMLSVKIIYMIHVEMRVNHFKFWILSAIEWRINEMMTEIKRSKKY
ncbi:MAG: hypothetical protein JSW47_04930 [Phycisphaerales bacterium]|nr:MAG: hypothetical protein JSW47_04930 [Phycisphaerales bacterium]